MIKLLDILKEITDADITWYHGSTGNIDQSDLNPLYRDSDNYKKDLDQKQKWGATGSSKSGIGVYFGSNKTDRCPSCPMQYTGFDSTDPDITEGFMYEMKLKSDAKIIRAKGDINIYNLSKESYNKLREEGIDALIDKSSPRSMELNLINPDAVQYFKKIMYWNKPDYKWINI